DFKIDDILNVPGDQLLAEVAEDFGDAAFLAAQFDSIALPAVSSHDTSGVGRGGAMTTFAIQPAAPDAASVRACPRPSLRAVSHAAVAMLAEWPAVPLRRHVFFGTVATLLLVAALTPRIYPLLVNRSADGTATVSQNDRQNDQQNEPLTQFPAPTSSAPSPTRYPARPELPGNSPMAPETPHLLQQQPRAEPQQLRRRADGSDQAAGPRTNREVSALPRAPVAPRAPAPQIAAAAPATAPAPAAAKPRVTEGDGFFV